ncbi:hypothetical protein BDV38DRAFT_91380 [Aspergillus pseudotamarii]|uniref:Uncharacterized protein n=1 Tax=Aspergillus pseudotamarii TaxID=132259 RepID=A0A5N6STQ8_ASPPS|nr:uncharacterized protein BDV38DRAFT_91380 [Aspergillus pseudotamarii]KAE8137209.1 hypothetical protein BDV38DRAFT_91380 [Aspergillus pseudotamarii]
MYRDERVSDGLLSSTADERHDGRTRPERKEELGKGGNGQKVTREGKILDRPTTISSAIVTLSSFLSSSSSSSSSSFLSFPSPSPSHRSVTNPESPSSFLSAPSAGPGKLITPTTPWLGLAFGASSPRRSTVVSETADPPRGFVGSPLSTKSLRLKIPVHPVRQFPLPLHLRTFPTFTFATITYRRSPTFLFNSPPDTWTTRINSQSR